MCLVTTSTPAKLHFTNKMMAEVCKKVSNMTTSTSSLSIQPLGGVWALVQTCSMPELTWFLKELISKFQDSSLVQTQLNVADLSSLLDKAPSESLKVQYIQVLTLLSGSKEKIPAGKSTGISSLESVVIDLEDRLVEIVASPTPLNLLGHPSFIQDIASFFFNLRVALVSHLPSLAKYMRMRVLTNVRYIQFTISEYLTSRFGGDWILSVVALLETRLFCSSSASEVKDKLVLDMQLMLSNVSQMTKLHKFIKLDTPKSFGSKVTLVIPAAGRSSRFPNMKPKWMLTQPNGQLMLADSIRGVDFKYVDRVVVGILDEHLQKHCNGSVEAVLKTFEKTEAAGKVDIVVIPEQTPDQVATVEAILEARNITGPILLKDCDNFFAISDVAPQNGVAYIKITPENEGGVYNMASKGYVAFKPSRVMTNIVEKQIISSAFACGAYAFESAALFRSYVDLSRVTKSHLHPGELAVSDVVWRMMLSGEPFKALECSDYEDWGTLNAWRAYCKTFKTLFVDIDGTLVKNSGEYFAPTWGSTDALPANAKLLRDLHATGRVKVILTTSRISEFQKETLAQLKKFDIPHDQILWGLPHASRILINDYASTNPYPSAHSINLQRNGDVLADLLRD